MSDGSRRGAGRPLKKLRDDGTPLAELAGALHRLREACGDPKYVQLEKLSGVDQRRLAEAARGDRLVGWDTIVAYVRGCWQYADEHGTPVDGSGDLSPWEQRYSAAGGTPWSSPRDRSTRRRRGTGTNATGHTTSGESEARGAARQRRWTLPRGVAAAIVILVAIVCVSVAALVYTRAAGASPRRQAADEASTSAAAGPATVSPMATVTSGCGDVAGAGFGLRAPGTAAFTDPIATNTLSIKGLSANTEQGMLDGQSYTWLVGYSVDGKGGIQLAWTGSGQWHRCNASAEIQRPGQPFMTAAVPVTIGSVAISYQACIWRSGPPFTEQCTNIFEATDR